MPRPHVKLASAHAYWTNSSVQYLAALACVDLVYNVVDSPVGTVPVTRVRTTDVPTPEWTDARVGRGHGSAFVEGLLYGTTAGAEKDSKDKSRCATGFYDAAKMAGLPVGVQIIGRRWEDEKVIELMRVVDAALGPREFGPGVWKGQGK